MTIKIDKLQIKGNRLVKMGGDERMKINGPNHMNFNPYKQQMEKPAESKKGAERSDALEISKEALKLQENQQPNKQRAEVVQEIKQQVETGEYKVDIERTAQKMIHFWRR
jgi:negative regulator of flagellin synthesis FlgM